MFRKKIIENLRKPKGLLGIYVSKQFKTNVGEYMEMLDYLNLQDKLKILEIGYGPGLGINEILKYNKEVTLDGIDFSKLMYKMALKNTKANKTQVNLYYGDFNFYDFRANLYDRIIAMNVIYFWDDVEHSLRKVKSLLNKNGQVIIDMVAPELLNTAAMKGQKVFNLYAIEYIKSILEKLSMQVKVYEYSKFKGCFFIVGHA